MNINLINNACREMRKDCLIMAKAAGKQGFHFGASFSMIEIAASLYLQVMNINKNMLHDENRDRFILSKGHGVPAVYAALKQIGVLTEQDLYTFKKDETMLYGHPCKNQDLGIEFSSGSLGQGLSFAVGIALALKRKENNISRVFVVLGDGECNEGAVWEAAMTASKYHLDNLIAIIDYNHLQYDGETQNIMPMGQIEEKWKSFGWETQTIDGHKVEQCCEAFSAKSSHPKVVIADTVKGKGISFMEHIPSWHFGIMTEKEEKIAWEEIEGDEN
ncbi:MAG: transketolase [Lachnospiraceae bacterium]